MHSGATSQSGRQLRLAYAHRAWVISFPRECTTTSLERNFPSHFIWKRGREKKALGSSYSVVKHHILTMCKTPKPPQVIRKPMQRSCYCQSVMYTATWHLFVCCFFVQFLSGSALCAKYEFWNTDGAVCVPCSTCKQYPKTPSCDTCEYNGSNLIL